jgi:hypothetical protein
VFYHFRGFFFYSNVCAGVLDLSENDFSGSISTEIGQLTGIQILVLQDNAALGGTVPTELGQLTKLYMLWLNDNDFEGTIPTEMGNCGRLSKYCIASV